MATSAAFTAKAAFTWLHKIHAWDHEGQQWILELATRSGNVFVAKMRCNWHSSPKLFSWTKTSKRFSVLKSRPG